MKVDAAMPETKTRGSDFHDAILRDENTLRLLRLIIVLVVCGSLVYFIAMPLSLENTLIRGPGLLIASSCALLAWGFLRYDRIDRAVTLLIWGMWVAMLLQIGITNGLMSRSLIALPILIVLAGWLLPPRSSIALCVATVLAGLGLALAEQVGALPRYVAPSPPFLVWLALTIYIVLAAAVAYHIFRGFRLRHEAMGKINLELSTQIDHLSAHEAELRLLMESVPVMLFHGDHEQRCLHANGNYANFYSHGRDDIIGLTVREIIGEEAYGSGVGEMLGRVLAGERLAYRAQRRSAAGENRVLDIEIVPEAGKEGQPRGFFAVFKDVTDQVHAEEALRRSEEKFSRVFRSSPIAFGVTRLSNGCYLDVNDAFERLFGWSREEIIGRTSLDIGKWLTPEERHDWAAALKQAGRVSNQMVRLRTRKGDIRDVLQSAELIELEGEPCALVMATDITARKRAEDKFAKIFQASPVAISISRLRDGHYLDANDAFVEHFGWAREEMIGHTSVELGLWPSQSDRDRWLEAVGKAGISRDSETRFNTKSGQQRTVLVSTERIDLDGEECLICMSHDITDRLQIEAALRDNEARLREAQRIGHVGSWDLDIVAKRMTWSDEVFRIYERPPGSFGGTFQDLLSMVHPEDVARMQQTYRSFAGPPGNYEFRHRILTPDDRVKHIHARWEVFVDKEGKPSRALGTAQDITEQVQANEEIQHLNAELESRVQERTAELQSANKELESFAYSISHDLRAPLRGIDGFSHLLAEEYGERLDAQGKSYLERVRAAAQRMGTLIDDILELSRVSRHSMRRTHVNLSRLARELLDDLAQGAPTRPVEIAIAEGCSAFGDPQLLRVMLQNLLENAWKYSGKEAAPQIVFGSEILDGERVFFVRDNGVGFDMKYADRLFTPFQRLHKPEEFAGTGIGLATVARVVHRHGGRVWAESEPGKGTVLRFTLGQASGSSQ